MALFKKIFQARNIKAKQGNAYAIPMSIAIELLAFDR